MGRRFIQTVAVLLLCAAPAGAQTDPTWRVRSKLLGSKGEKAEDISGIACSSEHFPRTCIVIDDETQAAQVAIVKDGEIVAGDTIPLITDRLGHRRLEFDGEGVAYSEGFFYAIGSHGHPRDRGGRLDSVLDAERIKASIAASSRIARIKLDPATVTAEGRLTGRPEVELSTTLRDVLRSQPDLQPFLDTRLEENGLTIEGIAVRDKRVHVGLRAPLLGDERAVILSLSLGALFDGKAPETRLQFVGLGPGRGIRDLVPHDRGFLVLAGPSGEREGPYAIYFWDGEGDAKLLADLPRRTGKKGAQLKPEALLTLDRSPKGTRVLVIFDGPSEGAPRTVLLPPR